jgi:hypothetical protein
MKIKVCYAEQPHAVCIEVEMPEGSTVFDAIEDSGIIEQCSVHLEECKVGIYSHFVEMTTPVKNEDRVEIYPPSTAKSKRKLGLR